MIPSNSRRCGRRSGALRGRREGGGYRDGPPRGADRASRPRRSNTRVGVGTFYEGVIASGYTTDDVDDALQRNVVGAGYGVPAQ